MNEQNVIQTIRQDFYSFRPAEQKVANYVLHNYEKVQYLSISELAELAEVADATVTRFCRTLNLKGFQNFKLAIASYIAGQSLPVSGAEQSDLLSSGRQSAEESKKAIDETIALLDRDDVLRAIGLFESAGRVLCAGSGGSMRIADECAHLFSIVDPKFLAVTDSHMQAAAVATMKENDVVLLISYSGATRNGFELLELAKRLGIKTVLITRFKKSPLGKLADLTLCCGSREGPYQLDSIAAKIALLTLTDVIFREYRGRHADTTGKNVRRIASALSDKHL